MKIFNWMKQHSVILLLTFIVVLLADIFIFIDTSDKRIVFILLMYWLYIHFNNFKSKITFFIALILLMGMFASLVMKGPNAKTEKLAVWVVLLLAFGIVQQWREISK